MRSDHIGLRILQQVVEYVWLSVPDRGMAIWQIRPVSKQLGGSQLVPAAIMLTVLPDIALPSVQMEATPSRALSIANRLVREIIMPTLFSGNA